MQMLDPPRAVTCLITSGPSGKDSSPYGRQARAVRGFSGPAKSVPFVHLFWPESRQTEHLTRCFSSRPPPHEKVARWTRQVHQPQAKHATTRAATGPSAHTGRGWSNPWSLIGSTPCPQSFSRTREIKNSEVSPCLSIRCRYASRTPHAGVESDLGIRLGIRFACKVTGAQYLRGLWLTVRLRLRHHLHDFRCSPVNLEPTKTGP